MIPNQNGKSRGAAPSQGRACQNSKAARGVFLSLDIGIAILLMAIVVAMAYAYYNSGISESGLGSRLMRSFAQDTVTVLAKKGYLEAPISSPASGTSGIREVLRSTPDSMCMQVSAYGTLVPDGLAGYWALDEDSGTSAYDSSGNNLAGTVHGFPGTHFSEGGISGRGAYFDGTGSVSLPGSTLLNQSSFSVAAWVKLDSTATQYIVYMPDGYLLYVDGAGNANFWASKGAQQLASSSSISSGQWHFIAGTYDEAANTTMIYIDGRRDGNATISSPAPYSGGTPAISPSGNEVQGYVDEVRIYGRALAQNEISLLYSNPANLRYVVDKPGCAYSGGEVQTLATQFVETQNQLQNNYYRAVFKIWLKGKNA